MWRWGSHGGAPHLAFASSRHRAGPGRATAFAGQQCGAAASAGEGWSAGGGRGKRLLQLFQLTVERGGPTRKREAHAGAFPDGREALATSFLASRRDIEELLMGMQERPTAGSLC